MSPMTKKPLIIRLKAVRREPTMSTSNSSALTKPRATRMKATKSPATKGGRPWTAEDKQYMRDQRDAGAKWEPIAKHLGRTNQACRLVYHYLLEDDNNLPKKVKISARGGKAKVRPRLRLLMPRPASAHPVEAQASEAGPVEAQSVEAQPAAATPAEGPLNPLMQLANLAADLPPVQPHTFEYASLRLFVGKSAHQVGRPGMPNTTPMYGGVRHIATGLHVWSAYPESQEGSIAAYEASRSTSATNQHARTARPERQAAAVAAIERRRVRRESRMSRVRQESRMAITNLLNAVDEANQV